MIFTSRKSGGTSLILFLHKSARSFTYAPALPPCSPELQVKPNITQDLEVCRWLQAQAGQGLGGAWALLSGVAVGI